LTTQDTKSILRLSTAFIASGVMLTVSQPPIWWWPLAWAAYVPFILVCSPKVKPLPLCLVAYVVGAFYWLGNIYWISFVTVSGWIAFCLYTALLWPILAITFRWCRIKRIPLIIAVPVLVVGAEQMQGLFLGGFYWHHLAHSQYANTTLIQIADIFGAGGVSFLAAMVNGLISQLIITAKNLELRIENSEKSRVRFLPHFLILNSKFSIIITAAAVVGAIGYGRWRINQSDKYITGGPIVGAVQTNIPQSVKQSFAAEEQIFDELLANSKQCVAGGAKLVVWPETMVQAILDPRVLRLLDESHSYKLFDKAIRQHAIQGAYVLVGAYGGNPRIENNFDIRIAQKYNSAFLYTPDGNQAPQKYNKIHLVPFGEILPFENIAFIHNLLLKMSPYDFDYTIDAGTEFTVFQMQPGPYKFSVMICYEDAVPAMARRFALDKQGRKQIDWLVNISNDGWFVRFKNAKVITSSELAQHTAVCAFRVVENRVAILRSVNTGISCLIDTLGRIKNGYRAGNLPQRAFDRQGVGGWFADAIPIDSRITFFSKYGQWLDFACQLCLAGLIIAQVVERLINRKATKLK
jgi:apolipoprotein N-acyltransferase